MRHDDGSHNGYSIVDGRPCHPWYGDTCVTACSSVCRMPQVQCISLLLHHAANQRCFQQHHVDLCGQGMQLVQALLNKWQTLSVIAYFCHGHKPFGYFAVQTVSPGKLIAPKKYSRQSRVGAATGRSRGAYCCLYQGHGDISKRSN